MSAPPQAPPFRPRVAGLKVRGKAPTTPLEVLSVTFDGASHHVEKQTRAVCVSGINNWWVETQCRRKVVVSQLAEKNQPVTCQECISRMDPVDRPGR
jgi:hypothetical protein